MVPEFSHIVGQDTALLRVEAARATGRLPHGLIFAGPEGVGKATAAAALAGVFLGRDDPQAATLVAAGTHPDYHVVRREQIREYDSGGKSKAVALGIDVVRHKVVEPAGRSSVRGAGKVFVLEEAQKMSVAAQNALLKTLEEPFGRTLIVLLTDEATALLPTIRSRCQTLAFARLTDEQTAEILAKHGLSPAEADAAARLSGGSPGRALRWHEDGVVGRAAELFGLLDAGDARQLPEFLADAAAAYADRALARDPLASKDAAAREGVAVYLALAADRERRRLAEAGEAAAARIDALHRAEIYLAGNVNTALVYQQLAAALA